MAKKSSKKKAAKKKAAKPAGSPINVFADAQREYFKGKKGFEKYADDRPEDINEETRLLGVPHLLHQAFLNRPGYALGRSALLLGPEGSAKTSMMFTLCNLGFTCGGISGLIETEHALEGDHIRAYMPDPEHHRAFQSRFLKSPTDLAEGLQLYKEMLEFFKEIDPDNEFPKVLAYDTLAGMTTKKEQGQETGQNRREIGDNPKIAANAGVITQAMGQIMPLLHETQTLGVFVNQGKENFDASGSGIPIQEIDAYNSPGGAAPGFFASYWWVISRMGKVGDQGFKVKCLGRKNKLGVPRQKMEFEVYYGYPFNYVTNTLLMLEGLTGDLKLVKKNNNAWKCRGLGIDDFVDAWSMYNTVHRPDIMPHYWEPLGIKNNYPANVIWPYDYLKTYGLEPGHVIECPTPPPAEPEPAAEPEAADAAGEAGGGGEPAAAGEEVGGGAG